jgi:hypothetical protein
MAAGSAGWEVRSAAVATMWEESYGSGSRLVTVCKIGTLDIQFSSRGLGLF